MIIHEIPNTPEAVLREVYDFLVFLKSRNPADAKQGTENPVALADSSWDADWNRPEEDEAWKDL